VRKSLYWPDGTRRNCSKPPDKREDEIHLLVQALVDQYNEDHNLLKVCSLSFCPHSYIVYQGCAMSWCLSRVMIADLIHSLCFRILHFNSRMSSSSNFSSLRTMSTTISISLQGRQELLILFLLKSNVHKESMRKWWSAVSALLNLMIMVFPLKCLIYFKYCSVHQN
jgi:hypothetical protein